MMIPSQAASRKRQRPEPQIHTASGYCGVYTNGKRWTAQIFYDADKHRDLGTFDTKQEAALAHDRAARQCGEKRRLNFESIEAAEEEAAVAQAKHALTNDMCLHPALRKPRPRHRATAV
jgi:hypothetical protein